MSSPASQDPYLSLSDTFLSTPLPQTEDEGQAQRHPQASTQVQLQHQTHIQAHILGQSHILAQGQFQLFEDGTGYLISNQSQMYHTAQTRDDALSQPNQPNQARRGGSRYTIDQPQQNLRQAHHAHSSRGQQRQTYPPTLALANRDTQNLTQANIDGQRTSYQGTRLMQPRSGLQQLSDAGNLDRATSSRVQAFTQNT